MPQTRPPRPPQLPDTGSSGVRYMPMVPVSEVFPSAITPAGENGARPPMPRIDILRRACEQAIETWKTSSAEQAPGNLMAVRLVQQQITNLKNRNPLLSSHTCYISWVDNWSPPGNL